MATIKPIFLLADSQLLFWRDEEGRLFFQRGLALMEEDEPGKAFKAAYLGASNGDAPEFYDLFVAAMGELGIRDSMHIHAEPSAEEMAFFEQADLILLAGGDIDRGWQAFQANGLQQKLIERYYGGAMLIGLSAGAVQLGLKGWNEQDETLFDTLRLVPFVVDAHDEPSWTRLHQIVPKAGEHARGFGIPSGGGAIYHPDYSVEPVRHPLVEVNVTDEGVRQALLFPGETQEIEEAEEHQPRPRVVSQEEAISLAMGAIVPEGPDDDPVN